MGRYLSRYNPGVSCAFASRFYLSVWVKMRVNPKIAVLPSGWKFRSPRMKLRTALCRGAIRCINALPKTRKTVYQPGNNPSTRETSQLWDYTCIVGGDAIRFYLFSFGKLGNPVIGFILIPGSVPPVIEDWVNL